MIKIHDGFRNRTVWEVFKAHTGRQVDKWTHYFDIYEKHFAKYVGKSPRVLEIGVDHGGSLQMWKEYFGPGSYITGVDINRACLEYTEPGIAVIITDQQDPNLANLGPFDIVIDDGSHELAHMSRSLKNLWPETTGVYLIEDCHYGMPEVGFIDQCEAVGFLYPYVFVIERAKRIIRGTPSRELRPDETEARSLYLDV